MSPPGKSRKGKALSPVEESMVASHELAQWLQTGRGLAPVQVPIMLGADEVAYAASSAQVLQRTAETADYQQTSLFAFGRPAFMMGAIAANAMMNRGARRRAEQAAAPQGRWRDSGYLFLTNQRMALQGSLSWVDWWFGALRSVNTDHISLMMYLDGCPPTALRCPSPGWWYVALHWLVFGSVPSMPVPADVLERADAIRHSAGASVLRLPRPTDG